MLRKYLSLTLLVSALMSPFLLAQTGTLVVNQQGPQQEVSSSQAVTGEDGSMPMAAAPSNADDEMTSDMDEQDYTMEDSDTNTTDAMSDAGVSPASASSDGSTIITRSSTPRTPEASNPAVPETQVATTRPVSSNGNLSNMSAPINQANLHDESEFGSVSVSGGVGHGAGSITTGKGYNS